MDYFIKAHVQKRKHISKYRRNKEITKKQLKQMLYGYKTSDNEIIKKSDAIKPNFDYSSSVSGFSDLNLSNTSREEDLASLSVESNVDKSFNNEEENSLLLEPFTEEKDTNKNSEDKTSSPFQNLSFKRYSDNISTSLNYPELSSGSSVLDPLYEDGLTEDFDGDGNLAAKIRKKLDKVKSGKVNLNKESIEDIENLDRLSKKKQKSFEKHENVDSLSEEDITSYLPTSEKPKGYKKFPNPSDSSPAFVSISADDMSPETFDGILGNYKHSTIKMISSDFHVKMTPDDAEFVPEDSMSVDINTEEEIGSLIPELGEDPSVDDIDVNLIEEPSQVCEDKNLIITREVSDLDEENNQDLSTVRLKDDMSSNFEFYYSKNSCIVIMRHYSELYLQGKVRLKALGGKVEVFGYNLTNEYQELYAPYCSIAQCIRTVKNNNVYYGLFSKLTGVGLPVADAENIVTSIGTQDAVVYLERYNCKRMDFIENNFVHTNLFDSSYKNRETHFKKASDILGCSLYLYRPRTFFVMHPSWKEAQSCAEMEHSRGIVCGGKGTGKSTYIRYQVNQLLEKGPVLVLDLDPGQSEFTVAGNLSATIVRKPLLGPNYTHLKKPEISLNIGMINTMDNVKRYVQAVQILISRSFNNKEFVNMPWLINTMGMTNDLGSKFMALIIAYTKPSYVIQHNSNMVKKCFAANLDADNVGFLLEKYKRDVLFRNLWVPKLDYTFIPIQDPGKKGRSNFALAPREERYLNFLAYFSMLINNVNDNILADIPYEVNLKQLKIYTNVRIKEEFIPKVISGKVVALCQQEGDSARVFTLADKPLLCHGHGLVRGIDWEKEMIYISTPLSIAELSSVNSLVYADWVPELITIESTFVSGTLIPYCTMAQEKQKHLMISPRRRFNPVKLLKMTRNA